MSSEPSALSAPTRPRTVPQFNYLDTAAAYFQAPLGKALGSYRPNGRDALAIAHALGWQLDAPSEFLDRRWSIGPTAHGTLFVSVPTKKGDTDPAGQWISEGTRDRRWLCVSNVKADQRPDSEQLAEIDGKCRAISSVSRRRAGWIIFARNGFNWVPKDDVRSFLIGLGYSKSEADKIIGRCVADDWTLVNLPFQEEYPGNRQWNLGAAQFAFEPAAESGPTPHWDRVFDWVGADLTEALVKLDWATSSGLATGGDYLRAWAACLLRYPEESLPFLFFYGEKQNSGKSMFHEALGMLMTGGYDSAKHALTNQNGFNGELANIVLAYIEETDISKSPGAYNKLKDWTTSPILSLRKMHTDTYAQVNTLHFVMTANHIEYCPVLPEDSRIMVIHVPRLPPDTEIPKPILRDRLGDEAPHFLRRLLDLQLPPLMGRMRLPVVETRSKQTAIEYSIPKFVLAIRDLMADRSFAELYTADYAETLGIGDWPKSIRGAVNLLSAHGDYLAERGITFTAAGRTKHGTPLVLRNSRIS